MAIGAVALSLPFAFIGSVYVSFLNELGIWQGLAAYSLLGTLILLGYLVASSIELLFKPI